MTPYRDPEDSVELDSDASPPKVDLDLILTRELKALAKFQVIVKADAGRNVTGHADNFSISFSSSGCNSTGKHKAV